MTTATLNPIEAFKPGTHRASNGAKRPYTAAELKQCAAVYDPALHRAPLVVGHPKTDDPAYGHVAALAYSEADERLIATPADVEPQFAELVSTGRLISVSGSFYLPQHPHNPVPGSLYLRHLGFLGAEPPAIKGLKRPSVSFSEADPDVVDFSDWTDGTVARLFGTLRDFLISKFGLDDANNALPSWRLEALAAEAVREEALASSKPQAVGLTYQEGKTVSPEELKAQADKLAADRAALDADRAAFAAREAAAAHTQRVAQFSEFTGGLVKDGKLLPVHQAKLVAVMGALPVAEVVEFAEGDALVKKPAIEVLQAFLTGLPKQVDFSERAADKSGKPGLNTEDPQAIAQAAAEFQEAESKAGRTVGIELAVAHVMRQAGE